MKRNIFLVVLAALLSTFTAAAQAGGKTYTVKAGDWLSKIAEAHYQNPHWYYKIIEATNAKAQSDVRYKTIENANALRAGQLLWIPELSTNVLTQAPVTDCEIRLWYNYQVVAIGRLNEKWTQDGLSIEERARKAYTLRHDARMNARFMMADRDSVAKLEQRDLKKYGNPHGPDFDYLLNKQLKNGLSKTAAFQMIIDSSSRTDGSYNADCL